MTIKLFTRDDLKQLITIEGGPYLSLFLPPPVIGNDTLEEEKTRLSNLVRSARTNLAEYWLSDAEVGKFLQPLEGLLEQLLHPNPRRHSVAVFVSSQRVAFFRVNCALDEQLCVRKAFYIRPLLPSLDEPDPYLVLTLSQQRARLLACTNEGLQRVEGILPESFEEFEGQLTVAPQTQVRSAAIGGRGGQGVVFHGQGGTRDAEKVDLENYLKHVDSAVCTYLQRHIGAQLILAGVDSLTAMYRANSHCGCIVDQTVSGNVDQLSEEELHARTTAIAKVKLHRQRQQHAAKIREQDVSVATAPEEILIAASQGRIDTLFIDQAARLYGTFIADRCKLSEVQQPLTADPAEVDFDLIELAAVQTLKTGGTVYAVPANDMPVAKPMVAALRF
jgi:Bacterial archaeo-eukaryotic release factor family 7